MSKSIPSKPAKRRDSAFQVRRLAGQTEWLAGRTLWEDGRVVWEHSRGRVAPQALDLAAAQRCLHQLRAQPELVAPSAQWLEARQARLELAKRLQRLAAPDLPSLVRVSRARNPAAVQRLVQLLVAEAVCLNDLPAVPTSALAQFGDAAVRPLEELLWDVTAPQPARALAAMVLGCVAHHTWAEFSRPAAYRDAPELLRQAFNWGRAGGLPAHPALTIAMLAEPEGARAAADCEAMLKRLKCLRFPAAVLRELHADGVASDELVLIGEAAAGWDQLLRRVAVAQQEGVQQLRTLGHQELAGDRQRRLAMRHAQTTAEVSDAICAYARGCRNAHALVQALDLTEWFMAPVWSWAEGTSPAEGSQRLAQALEHAVRPITHGAALPAELQPSYLQVLEHCRATRWSATPVLKGKDAKLPARFNDWINSIWLQDIKPLTTLLERCRDADVVCESIDLNLHRWVRAQPHRDTATYRLLVATVRRFALSSEDRWFIRSLQRLLERYATAAAAKAALAPVFEALPVAPAPEGRSLLDDLLTWVPSSRHGRCVVLPGLAPAIPQLLRFARGTVESHRTGSCVEAAIALFELSRRNRGLAVAGDAAGDPAQPGSWTAWLSWLLTHLLESEQKTPNKVQYSALDQSTLLAATLAEGDLASFQQFCPMAIRQQPAEGWAHIGAGLAAARPYPLLRHSILRLFPTHPARCLSLLVRLGLTARLGAAVLKPLEALNLAQEVELSPSWREVADALPSAMDAIRQYVLSELLLEQDASVPSGISKSLALAARLTRELEFVENRLREQPPRADLQARAISLRGQLQDGPRLQTIIGEEVEARLTQAAAQAYFQLAEQQTLGCYRARLAQVAGDLPPQLVLDDDLLNATLLTTDIESNRRLLRRLLRAHLDLDRGWREQHPANRLLLRVLEANGVNVAAWLRSWPCTFVFAHAPGGKVRLHLESNPLRILQMGNYFDTCLSFGGCNSFSTVTNACELNKRVVFAEDANGRVVGRNLIGISNERKLVGFHTYTSLADAPANQGLRTIFTRYLRRFAERCNLELADEGTVPLLFAEDWYDDGTEKWGGEDESLSRAATSSGQAAHHVRRAAARS